MNRNFNRGALKLIFTFFITLITSIAQANAATHPGQAGFMRCAACHLAEGQGIAGAFPPLKGHIARIAAQKEGRGYLVAVVKAGLIGPIQVNGLSYSGVMPAQGASFDAKAISDVLNYTIEVLDKSNVSDAWTPFYEEEVANYLRTYVLVNGQGVARMRRALADKYPELF